MRLFISLKRRARAPHAWLTPRSRRGALRRAGEPANRFAGIANGGRLVAVASILLLSTSLTAPAWAQTVMGTRSVPATPPGKSSAPARAAMTTQSATSMRSTAAPAAPAQVAQPTQPLPATPQLPMPTSAVMQAADQAEGIFPAMARAGAGGQIQESWNVSEPRDGVYAVRVCDDCVYKVRTREFMATTIVLPADAVIATADLGDPTGFQVQVRAANMIAVRPSTYGVDTNLNVYTKAGAVYPFYLRAESFNSTRVPDVVVRLLGREAPAAIKGADEAPADKAAGKESAKPGNPAASAVHDLTNPTPSAGDFVRTVPFDPSKLRGWRDYKLWGGGDQAEELKPEVVYRDDFFTYLQYGKAFDQVELPSAYVVRDGIDELVNSRVQGGTFIVESTAPLISLKNGKSFLCVQHAGEKS